MSGAPKWVQELCDYLEPEDWRWDAEEECWISEEEGADGVPGWRIYSMVCGDSFWVHYTLGWYEQRGDADDRRGVKRLMRAMEAASKTVNESLLVQAMEAASEDHNEEEI